MSDNSSSSTAVHACTQDSRPGRAHSTGSRAGAWRFQFQPGPGRAHARVNAQETGKHETASAGWWRSVERPSHSGETAWPRQVPGSTSKRGAAAHARVRSAGSPGHASAAGWPLASTAQAGARARGSGLTPPRTGGASWLVRGSSAAGAIGPRFWAGFGPVQLPRSPVFSPEKQTARRFRRFTSGSRPRRAVVLRFSTKVGGGINLP
jgi:hypothetical protein